MLVIAASVLLLIVIGLAAVAKIAQLAMARLGLRPMSVALYFGLAEAPTDELVRRRRLRAV